MRRVCVDLGDRSYDIHTGADLRRGPAAREALAAVVAGRRCALVTDGNVGPIYEADAAEAVRAAGAADVAVAAIKAGEAHKTLATLEALYHFAVAGGLDRRSVVVALGGGVVGDVAGFFAATYMRGVGYLQVPTSLLAMVDSSVGGKTAVDLPEGKNLVGAFHQPELVLAELLCLRSLPDRELRCGLGEAIKYGVIMDADFFAFLEEAVDGLRTLDLTLYEEVVARCCALKAEVVAEDETEAGRRAILNYGHTFGHALETLTGYGVLTHGEAVAVGMGMAADLAADTGLGPAEVSARQDALLAAVGLPARLSGDDLPTPADVLETMGRDKKVRDGRLRLVLPTALGAVSVLEVADRDAVLKAIGGRLG